MSEIDIKNCPGTLKSGHSTYSTTALNRVFDKKKVSPILPYDSPATNSVTDELFVENQQRISISGVQEKFSVRLEKNKLRLIHQDEQGQYILKPQPNAGKNSAFMPANEHLTMQIARQVFGIETAENALIFFKNGAPAYITKRFDVKPDGTKWAQEDFASLAGRTSASHGDNYKYLGNYAELFEILKRFVPAYAIEAPKLFKLILFNYLVSNGDAHYKNFSLLETAMGDFKLSPAYDLLNSRMHINDKDFALEDALLPPSKTTGKIREQFYALGELAGMKTKQIDAIFALLTSKQTEVQTLISHSYLPERLQRNYEQAYLTRLNKLIRK